MSKYENILEKYFTRVGEGDSFWQNKLVEDVYAMMVSENQIIIVRVAVQNMLAFAVAKHGVLHTFFTEEELETICQTIL